MAEIKLCAFSDEAASDILGQINALKQNGIFLTELRSAFGKNVSEFTKAESKEYYKMFRDNGIGVYSIGSPLGKVDIDTKDGDINSLVNRIKTDKVLTLEPHLAIFEAYANIDNTEMKHKFHFENNLLAFTAAADALKAILLNNGFVLKANKYVK